MKRTLIIILVVIVLILSLGIAGMLGYVWYRDNHVFVDGTAYPIKAESFDLREEDISFAHYEELQGKLPDAYILWNVPFQDGRYPSDSRSLTVSSLTEEDVAVISRSTERPSTRVDVEASEPATGSVHNHSARCKQPQANFRNSSTRL